MLEEMEKIWAQNMSEEDKQQNLQKENKTDDDKNKAYTASLESLQPEEVKSIYLQSQGGVPKQLESKTEEAKNAPPSFTLPNITNELADNAKPKNKTKEEEMK